MAINFANTPTFASLRIVSIQMCTKAVFTYRSFLGWGCCCVGVYDF